MRHPRATTVVAMAWLSLAWQAMPVLAQGPQTSQQTPQQTPQQAARQAPHPTLHEVAQLVAQPVAPQAHQHGVVTLEIVQEGGRLTVSLDAPQESLLGHERVPRTPAEREAAAALLQRLRQADPPWGIDVALKCRPGHRELQAPALESASAAKHIDHADIEFSVEYACAGTAALRQLDVGALLNAYKGIGRIEARVVTPAGQFKAALKRPARLLVWGR